MTYETRYTFRTIDKRLRDMDFHPTGLGVCSVGPYVEYRDGRKHRVMVMKRPGSSRLEISTNGTEDVYELQSSLGLK